MKIAISVKEKNLQSEISEIFGRSVYFVLATIENGQIKETEIIENKNVEQTSGAGVSTARLMAENDVEIVIAGNIGPRAEEVLKQFGIKIRFEKGIAQDFLKKYQAEKINN